MSSKKHTLATVIGGFRPPHKPHSVLFRKAFHIADNVLIQIGSAHAARNIRCPFSYAERRDMIQNSLRDEEQKRLMITPLVDNLYSDDQWMKSVQASVKQAQVAFQTWTDKGGDGSVVLVGNKKDETSYYLDLFPQYAFENIDEFKMGFDATTVRRTMFAEPEKLDIIRDMLSDYTFG
jgi:bifunctional NMN adenylyltransferase/nudix hydrolase